MHEFIAKHQDQIAGTLSGFDRLVFRGHLRSIGTPQGMMSYLWTNQVLLKNFGDHVEKVTERVKEASLAAAKACRRVSQFQSAQQRDHRPRHPGSRWRPRRPGVRAQLSRTLLEVRDPSQSNDEKTRVEATPWQMPVPLPLPGPSCLRLSQCPHPNLVPVLHSDLPQRTGMAGATDASRRSGVPAA